MRVRWVGALLALALASGATGYAVRRLTEPGPSTLAAATPVPAVSPSDPVVTYPVEPDPTAAPLSGEVPLRPIVLREGGLRLRVSVPVGWRRVALDGASWNFTVDANPLNTYLLRVGIVAGDRRSPWVETRSRITALRAADRNGSLDHFAVESSNHDGFEASYVDGGYQRYSIERFLALGSSTAYATVAVIGRGVDRPGLQTLLDRVAASAAR